MTVEMRGADLEQDGDAVWTMLKPVFRAGGTYAVDAEISRADALNYWFQGRAYVAELDGAVAGTFYIKANQPGGGAHVCNCGYVTARGAEGKGLARGMLAFSLEEAKSLGFEAMQFNFVLANNMRAVATWERAGFDVIGQIPKAFKLPSDSYTDALIMHRFL